MKSNKRLLAKLHASDSKFVIRQLQFISYLSLTLNIIQIIVIVWLFLKVV